MTCDHFYGDTVGDMDTDGRADAVPWQGVERVLELS